METIVVKPVPESLGAYVLPFNWDVRKVWALAAPVVEASRSDFDRLLFLPLWSSRQGEGMLFDLTPMEVIRSPERWPYQAKRLGAARIDFPLDFLRWRQRLWILDGVHRLAKHFLNGTKKIPMRIHGDEIREKIEV